MTNSLFGKRNRPGSRRPADQSRREKPRRTRPRLESLEDRVLLEAQPVNLGEHLQFRLVDRTAEWTQSASVYSTTGEVMIGLQTASFQPLLLVEKGVAIDTNATRQSFTIKATQNAHNTLAYFPNSLTLLSPLWQFQLDYVFRGPDLQNLVCLDPNLTCTPVTVAGAAVLPVADDVGLKIANMTGPEASSTLVPSTLYITQSNNALKTPQLKLSGRLSLNMASSKLAKLVDHLHVSFGDSGTYAVTADAVGLVELGSKTGSGVWLSISPGE